MTEAVETPEQAVDQEEWFLDQLGAETLDIPKLVEFLQSVHTEGAVGQAESWFDLLLETLVERDLYREAVHILGPRIAWEKDGAEARAKLQAYAREALARRRDEKLLVDQVGFDNRKLTAAECLRRLDLLLGLDRGHLCYDATWGFGVVQRVDFFYKRVEIDFEHKAGHELSLAYAGETLELLDEEHVLTRRHRDPEGIQRLVKEDPAEVVRMALRSYGPLSIAVLQEHLVPAFVAEEGWKTFWDGARKVLKQDPMVDIPSRRSEPIRLLARAKAFDDQWFADLRATRDLKTVLKLVEELTTQVAPDDLSTSQRDVLHNRLAFVIKGADPRWPGLISRALMAAKFYELDGEGIEREVRTRALLKPARLIETTGQLPARFIRPFMDYLMEGDEEATLEVLATLIPEMGMSLLGEVVTLLRERGREAVCQTKFRELVINQEAGVEVLNWVARNMDYVEKWGLGTVPELALLMLTRLEDDHMGDRLRAENQLRERFSRDEWFLPALDSMTADQRHDFAMRLKDSPAFFPMDRRSLIGRGIKRYPALQEVMSQRHATEEVEESQAQGRFTSRRSYHERQAQLQHIVNVEIPQNSKEIGVARSYGDLRENHEFKAAKEMQGILMRRQTELEEMLHAVKPSDFLDVPCEVAAVATRVVLAYDDGRQEQYHILGEWDRDEALHIISSTTRMAQALMGAAPGDRVVVPTEEGETTCTVAEVAELPPEVQAWIGREEQGA